MNIHAVVDTLSFVASLRVSLRKSKYPIKLKNLVVGEIFIFADSLYQSEMTIPANSVITSTVEAMNLLWKKSYMDSAIGFRCRENGVEILPDHTIRLSPNTLVYRITTSRETIS